MPYYQHDVSLSKQKKFKRRVKKSLFACLMIVLLVGIIVIVDALLQSGRDNSEQGKPSVTVVKADTRDFTTSYFTFTVSDNWTDVPKESTAQKFVYRSFRGQLVEQELKIYVNTPSADLAATRVMPVSIVGKQSISPDDVSEHCIGSSAVKKASVPVEVSILGTKMMCQLDGTNYLVVLGEKGGNTAITLQRQDGSTAVYGFIYRSSSNPPDTLPLTKLLGTFKPM